MASLVASDRWDVDGPEGTALSRHRTAMLEPAKPTTAKSKSRTSATGPQGSMPGPRSSRRKRGLLRRTGIVFPAAVVAVLMVVGVGAAAYLRSSSGEGASGLAQAIDALPKSNSIALLEAERQQLIVMDAAAKTLSVAAKPKMVSPSQVMASESAAAESANSDASSSSTSTGGDDAVSAPPPDPGTAQSIGYDMLPSFGFSQSSQWGCLLDLWNQESGWIYDAENPSGAYGIPQALPASKMASAGADYLTDPTTQIRWGLGYISEIYGTPCDAWDHEEADGWY
jgi:hypothetical protein